MSQTDFASNCINTNKTSLDSLGYFASKVRNMVPLAIKLLEVLKYSVQKFEIESLKIVIVTCVISI